MKPPAVADWFFGLLAPDHLRRDVLGDLHEEFRRFTLAERSSLRARLWYWRQVIGTLARYRLARGPSGMKGPRRRRGRGNVAAASFGIANLAADVRYSIRALLRRPMFTIAAVSTLGLGIGANTTVFSVVDGVLLKPLPYQNPDQLLGVFRYDSTYMGSNPTYASLSGWYAVPWPLFQDWKELNTVFDDVGAYRTLTMTLTGDDQPERVAVGFFTSGVFAALEVPPFLGRTFVPDDDNIGELGLAVLSYGLWQRRFGSDSTAIGRQLVVNGTSHIIVGVMPAGFGFPNGGEQLWVTFDDGFKSSTNRRGGAIQVLARMRSGVSFEQSVSAMHALARQIHETHPEDVDQGVRLVPRKEMEVAATRGALLLLLGTVGTVLLIACTNISSLLLVRSTERRRELCVRKALGAGKGRLIGQLLSESLVLSLVGGTVGCLIAIGSIRPFTATLPGRIPRLDEVGIDYRMLAFTVGLALLTGVLMGILPAFRAATTPIAEALQSGGRGFAGGLHRTRVQSTLVVSEVAMAFVLLVGAGLFIKSFVRLTSVDRGFVSQNLLTLGLSLPEPYRSSEESTRSFFSDLTERLEGIPGVEGVGGATRTPLVGGMSLPPTLIETSAEVIETAVHTVSVTPPYFEVLGIPLVAGRTIAPADREGASPVVVVNQSLARRYWSDTNPIGLRLKSPGDSLWSTVVGVVRDFRQQLGAEPAPTVYAPFAQRSGPFQAIVLKSAIDPAVIADAAREAVWAIDPNLPVTVNVLDDLVGQSSGVAGPRFVTLLISFLAGVAALLAFLGVYAVLAYTVTQRNHEIGIRMALGAATGNVVGDVVRRGFVLVGTGLAIGLIAALFASRIIESFLFGVSPTDPMTLAGVAAIVTTAALAASYLPARRATKVDPLSALRSE